jgi:hypothetical protein
MTTATTAELPDGAGLLDGEEHVERVELSGEEDDCGPYPPGTFRKIASGMVTLALAITATYVIPDLHFARPWVPGVDPVLFWNVVGREILGEGEEAAEGEQKLAQAEELAAAVVAEDETQMPLVEEPVVEPPPKGEGLPPYEPHPDDAEPVPRSLCPRPPRSTRSTPGWRAPMPAMPGRSLACRSGATRWWPTTT